MARKRAQHIPAPDAEIIAYYQDRLSRPAPPVGYWKWEPKTIGPTWQRTDDGYWLLPERTLGWHGLAWCGQYLHHSRGDPWAFTDEQARWWLWWYALDDDGRFTSRDAILQRLKGWGKDPMGACLCANEALGPARFAEWDNDEPVPVDCPEAWVQIAAVALEQTKTTMRLFPRLFTDDARKKYRLQIGREVVHALADTRLIQAVTSSPATLEGARSTFVMLNETHHWDASNAGHDMADVIERNATKSPDGAARTARFTNAYDPAQDSVAQRDREAWEDATAGESLTTGILYDSLEAADEAPLTAEDAPEVIESIRGDSEWLDVTRITKSILDTRNPPSRSRRFWYNQVTATEDAWIIPQDFDQCASPHLRIGPRDELVVFFDGSKSDDATAIVGCRLSDGHLITLGMWQRPPKGRGEGWTAPRRDIDARMTEIMATYKVVALFADPSHTVDDETQERYWDDIIDGWHRKWHRKLEVWAQPGKHSTLWDMTSPARVEEFTAAAERTAKDIADHTLTHDGDGRLRIHCRNARRYPNKYGVSLWKGHRESKKKIDLAVCAVGSRMVRRMVLNDPKRRKRGGKVWS